MTHRTDILATFRRRLPLRERFFAWLLLALERQRTRHDLARLDAAALRDIGLTQAEATQESAKPFWR